MRSARSARRWHCAVTVVVLLMLAQVPGVVGVSTVQAASTSGALTMVPGTTNGRLLGISCLSAGNCTAVGGDASGGPIYATEVDGSWSAANALPGGNSTYLNAVSCVTATTCTAVGVDVNQPIYVEKADGVWGSISALAIAGGAIFTGVSCTSELDCTAVGTTNSPPTRPVTATKAAGVWGPVQVISSSFESSFFKAVSCSSSTECTAVGLVGQSGGGSALASFARKSGSNWSPGTLPINISGNGLTGVSCTAPLNCTAVGSELVAGGGVRAIVVTETAGAWGAAAQISGPSGSRDSNLFGVSCPTTDDCVAAGLNQNTAFRYDPAHAVKSNGAWSSLSTAPSGGSFGAFYGVSCNSTALCTAVGQINLSNGRVQPVYQRLSIRSQSPAGRVIQVTGSAHIVRADGTRETAVVDSLVWQGDVVETDKTGAAEILFADNTTFALGESARMSVDQFVYHPGAETGNTFFAFLQGIFVYTSGLIGQEDPESVNIETPTGSIGIRGTEFIARAYPDGDFARIDLIHGQVAFTPRLSDASTIVDAPETAVFNSSSLIRTAPLTQAQYDQLKTQLTSMHEPNMNATLTNTAGGMTQVGRPWNWNLRVTNLGDASAFFNPGSSILLDQLPTAGVAYGPAVVRNVNGVTGNFKCDIDAAKNLRCTPKGSLAVAPNGFFDVVVTATPLTEGTITNPRASGICGADPYQENVESNGVGNPCADVVTVSSETSPCLRVLITPLKPLRVCVPLLP